jgi:hypothetical protein
MPHERKSKMKGRAAVCGPPFLFTARFRVETQALAGIFGHFFLEMPESIGVC